MKEIIESALNQGLSSLITISIFLLLYKWLDNKKKTESEKFVSSISSTLDEISKSFYFTFHRYITLFCNALFSVFCR